MSISRSADGSAAAVLTVEVGARVVVLAGGMTPVLRGTAEVVSEEEEDIGMPEVEITEVEVEDAMSGMEKVVVLEEVMVSTTTVEEIVVGRRVR